MEKFLETYNLPKFNEEEAESLNSKHIKALGWMVSQNYIKYLRKS